MNVARRESVPIGERTSDNWGRVRREAVPRQARAPSYIVDCLTVTGGPLARPPAPEGLGDKRERPPPIGVPRSAPRRVGICTAMPPPARGSLPHHSPCRKAVQRREETADHQFVGGREPVWPAPSSKGTGRCAADRADLGGRLSCREGRALSWRSGFPGP